MAQEKLKVVEELVTFCDHVTEFEKELLEVFFESRKDGITILEAIRPVQVDLLKLEKHMERHMDKKKNKRKLSVGKSLPQTEDQTNKKSNTGGDAQARNRKKEFSFSNQLSCDETDSPSACPNTGGTDEEYPVEGGTESGSQQTREEEGEDASLRAFLENSFTEKQKANGNFELHRNQRLQVTYELLNKWGKPVGGDLKKPPTDRSKSMAYTSIRRFVLYLYLLRSKKESFFQKNAPFLFPRTFASIWKSEDSEDRREIEKVVEKYRTAFEEVGMIPQKDEPRQGKGTRALWRKEFASIMNSIRKEAKPEYIEWLEDESKLDKNRLESLSLNRKLLAKVDAGPLPAEHPFIALKE